MNVKHSSFSAVFGAVLCLIFGSLGLSQQSGMNYSHFDHVLKSYVDDLGYVDYLGLKENPSELLEYLSQLASLDPVEFDNWREPDKIAFWINAYNALTIKVILDHYPIKSSFFRSLTYPKNSIRQIGGVWDKITFPVMGRRLTLDEIEHKILRSQFHEPRIHMALVCAARSCPPLRNEPYEGSQLEEQLKDQARKFLAEKRNFFVDQQKRMIYLSSIFKWYGEDFVPIFESKSDFKGRNSRESAVLAFISLNLPEDQGILPRNASYRIKYTDYDWRLNEKEN